MAVAGSDDRRPPEEVYRERLERRRQALSACERRDRALANAKTVLFLAALALLIVVLVRRDVGARWLLLPLPAFLPLAVVHENVLRARRRAARSVEFYERGLARLQDRWPGAGPIGTEFLDPDHLYAADLDLFGQGSLFQLLCQARTRAGEETLAAWLLRPASREVVRDRQDAVAELRRALDLREELAILGSDWQAAGRPRALQEWCLKPPLVIPPAVRLLAWVLPALGIGALVGWIAFGTGASPLAAVVAVQILYRLRLRSSVRHVADGADDAVTDLRLLSGALARFENASFHSPLLQSLRRRLETGGRTPSQSIRKLGRLVDCFEGRRNQLFAVVSFLLLWDVHFAWAIESWRAAHGRSVPGWLATLGELEALSSFASYAYERPADPFPEVLDSAPCLEIEGLGHPLIAESLCVRNDLRLDGDRGLLIVSGSNMSGKSTFLRSAGVAVVMALAGAPVRAARMRLSPLAVSASIRVLDSLQAGTSHFYAEIQRLRRIVGAAGGEVPAFFLVDEILQGTNSHDRRIGVEAVLRTLLERGALGLITTHDLALTAIAESLAPRVGNVHFDDRIEDGRMVFDYVLRPGVVTRSNALDLMRAVGLEV